MTVNVLCYQDLNKNRCESHQHNNEADLKSSGNSARLKRQINISRLVGYIEFNTSLNKQVERIYLQYKSN